MIEPLDDIDKKWDRDFWTQEEVADYFRVVPSTIKNWRDRGLLKYWQAPGSSRILYHRDGIMKLQHQFTSCEKGGKPTKKEKLKVIKKKSCVSSKPNKEWRI